MNIFDFGLFRGLLSKKKANHGKNCLLVRRFRTLYRSLKEASQRSLSLPQLDECVDTPFDFFYCELEDQDVTVPFGKRAYGHIIVDAELARQRARS